MVGKNGARAAAAAFAVGLSLAGPQSLAIATAAPQDGETGSVAAGSGTRGTADSAANRTSHRAAASAARAPQAAAARKPRPAASAARPIRPAPVSVVAGSQADPDDTPAAPAATVAGAEVAKTPPVLGQLAPAVRAARTAALLEAPAVHQITALQEEFGRILDAAANRLNGLPGGLLTEFLQGALILVRRTFFPGIGVNASPYFTSQQLRDYLLSVARQRYGGVFGQTVPVYNYGPWMYDAYLKDAATPPVTSDTNTQVDGVDEADYVETDGHYVYVARNGELKIVGSDASVVSTVSLSGSVVGQFLSGDRLTVITQSGNTMIYARPIGPMPWGGWNPQTTVTVFDVSDRSAPAIVNQRVFDGAYRDARSVDGVVHLVLDGSIRVPEPLYTDTPVADAPDPKVGVAATDTMIRWGGEPTVVANRTYETWDAYVARVGGSIIDSSLPHAYRVEADGTLVDLGVYDAGRIVRPQSNDDQSLVTVVSIDSGHRLRAATAADGAVGMVAPSGGTVYMTRDALYLATQRNSSSDSGSSTDTRLDRFSISGTKVRWQASGVAPGTLINQFAMDEQGGYLRVATHTTSYGWVDGTWTTRNDNGVYILDTAGRTLDEVGRVTGLAPGEQLYAVRFIGDTAYLVTFLRTDPLFAVDLSDPSAPNVKGELVIPGFSNYLQQVGDGLLLGIGQERQPGSWNIHVHASLFDVSDPTNLTQIDRTFLDDGAQWSWSDAQFDPHAVLYSPEDGLLVLPVSAGGYDPVTGQYRSVQMLKVLRVGPDGLTELGEIRTDEPVIRTVRIGDALYAVSDNTVTVYHLESLTPATSL